MGTHTPIYWSHSTLFSKLFNSVKFSEKYSASECEITNAYVLIQKYKKKLQIIPSHRYYAKYK